MELSQPEKATNAETWNHINLVMQLLASAQIELMRRQFTHDRSKLLSPEVSTFTEFTPKLKASTYGSDEYKQMLAEMKPALDHHYAHNRHHPEFFEANEQSLEVKNQIETAKHALKYVQVYPDDVFAYEALIRYLEKQQAIASSSVNNMNLFDVLEMVIDWYAATKRHSDGDISKSIQINKDRFGLSDQLVSLIGNTIPWIVNEFEGFKSQKDLGA